MSKKFLIACIINIGILCYGTQRSTPIRSDKEYNLTIQRALSLTITNTDCTESTVAHDITDQAFKQVMNCDYKAMVSWAQYFTYKNDYYNAYVHYAIALGVLGYKEEMMRALLRSASFINKDLTYFEFKEIIDFFESLNL